MDGHEPETIDGQTLAETPEDVAVLYSWANLQGAKYRDFSASRREYRAQMRHRAAQAQRDSEERAKEEAERSALEAERAAREAEEAARFHGSAARDSDSRTRQEIEMEEAAQARAMRHAAELSRRAAAERVEAARRAEAVAAAEAAARREAREMAEARASAQRQAQRYEASEVRRRSLAGPQPVSMLGGEITDPYTDDHIQQLPGRIFHQPNLHEDDMLPQRHPQTRDVRLIVPQPDPVHPHEDEGREYLGTGSVEEDARIAAGGAGALHHAAETKGSPISYYYEPDSVEKTAAVDSYAQFSQYVQSTTPAHVPVAPAYDPVAEAEAELGRARRPRGYQPDEASGFHQPVRSNLPPAESSVPAWISSQPEKPRGSDPLRRVPASPVEDTLQHSRERVAARWFALKGVFDHGVQEQAPEANAARAKEMRVPLLTVFSMAGGVGKTSLVATLGRALSSAGEKVLLTDTTSHGLLPFYFGASELRPGVVRTFSPPCGKRGRADLFSELRCITKR